MQLTSVAGSQNMLDSKMLMMSLCIDPISLPPDAGVFKNHRGSDTSGQNNLMASVTHVQLAILVDVTTDSALYKQMGQKLDQLGQVRQP
jgi:hypothetical protein